MAACNANNAISRYVKVHQLHVLPSTMRVQSSTTIYFIHQRNSFNHATGTLEYLFTGFSISGC
ncbi:hypothetical protein BDV35DRAFT_385204 [Aspergillus flavus]|uniref:Uncharacterized protein n=1 Tax=Aspergillus flavus TaxID=5059 RepID=A0A5N6GIU4_ASPFL|nr:hypothetical protein BDV35DRAFT_385204 [Aspergillus flavus]